MSHRLLSRLYREKSHIDILRYLGHVEMNFILAGYRVSGAEIRTRFAKLFPQLGLQAAKGRDARKFVYVHDAFGVQEPFVLLTLECDDES